MIQRVMDGFAGERIPEYHQPKRSPLWDEWARVGTPEMVSPEPIKPSRRGGFEVVLTARRWHLREGAEGRLRAFKHGGKSQFVSVAVQFRDEASAVEALASYMERNGRQERADYLRDTFFLRTHKRTQEEQLLHVWRGAERAVSAGWMVEICPRMEGDSSPPSVYAHKEGCASLRLGPLRWERIFQGDIPEWAKGRI